jgi:tetratricopeptide (TPR) repeat protein
LSRFALRAALGGALSALALGLLQTPAARAFPPFTQKEGKPCGFCHVKPEGGGKRNYRGLYYKAHELSFKEFDDAAEAKKAGEEVALDPDPTVKPKSWTAPPAPVAEEKTPEPEAPAEVPKGPSVTDLKKKANAAQAVYQKKPKDAKAKAAYAEALAQLGHAQMLDQNVPPVQRYPTALKTLRQARTLNPKNKTAIEDITQIENAYKSLGRPIPK